MIIKTIDAPRVSTRIVSTRIDAITLPTFFDDANDANMTNQNVTNVLEKTMTVQTGPDTSETRKYCLARYINYEIFVNSDILNSDHNNSNTITTPNQQRYIETYIYYYTTQIVDSSSSSSPVYIYNLYIVTDLNDYATTGHAQRKLPEFTINDTGTDTHAHARPVIVIPHTQKMNFQELWNPVVNEKWIFDKQQSGIIDRTRPTARRLYTLSATPV
jgi:hypothetical protein